MYHDVHVNMNNTIGLPVSSVLYEQEMNLHLDTEKELAVVANGSKLYTKEIRNHIKDKPYDKPYTKYCVPHIASVSFQAIPQM